MKYSCTQHSNIVIQLIVSFFIDKTDIESTIQLRSNFTCRTFRYVEKLFELFVSLTFKAFCNVVRD